MFTFALKFFLQAIDIFLFILNLSSDFRGKRKKEFGRNHSQRKPLTTTTT